MDAIELTVESGPDSKSVSIRVRNSSAGPITVVAPNPYLAVWLVDRDGDPYPRVRAVAWTDSRKTKKVQPNEEILITIDLLDYWDGVCGDACVSIRFEVIDEAGVCQEKQVEGNVFLNIPSFEQKSLAWKNPRKPRGVPMKLFDVSDSTHFQ
jgi:hypothetical protein